MLAETSSGVSRRQDRIVVALVWLACVGAMLALHMTREVPLHRDFAIIFGGAARTVAGQWPFGDFGMPNGSVSILAPSLAMWMFGTNWAVFQFTQLAMNAAIMLSLAILMRQLSASVLTTIATLVVTTVFYLVFLSHPWYNTTALLLLIVTLNFSLAKGVLTAFLAGVLAMACVFTKQDFGVAAIGVNGAVLLFRAILNGEPVKGSIMRLAAFAAGLGLGLVGFMALYPAGHLAYWFNHGQPPHQARMPSFKDNKLFATLGLSILLLVYSLMKKRIDLFVPALVLISAHLTASLSGQSQTHYYGVAMLPIVLSKLAEGGIRSKEFFGGALLAGLVFSVSAHDTVRLYYRIASGKEAERGQKVLNGPVIHLGDCAPAFGGAWGPETVCKLYADLRQRIADGRLPPDGQILNASELTPMTPALGYAEAAGYPLWYDRRVVLFDREVERILADLRAGRFDVVLVQGVHGGMTDFHWRVLEQIRSDRSYEELTPPYVGPSGVGSCPHPDGACEIHAFVRRKP